MSFTTIRILFPFTFVAYLESMTLNSTLLVIYDLYRLNDILSVPLTVLIILYLNTSFKLGTTNYILQKVLDFYRSWYERYYFSTG
jgi:hypothetical protein